MKKAYIGVIGLGVMGQNLARNIIRNGYQVSGYNRSQDKVDEFRALTEGERAFATSSLDEFLNSLESPKRIIIMVKDGAPVDEVLTLLRPRLAPGDIVIDTGNEHYQNTERRLASFEGTGVHYVGSGVSGGEEGALWGPAIMPGGDKKAWKHIEPVFRKIAAKASEDGAPCVSWIGPGGSGHFVKMVHNAIEYGDMQMIAESYALMSEVLGMKSPEIAKVFATWNKGELKSYLIEITAIVLSTIDEETGKPLVDMILDSAQQKGTGKWASQLALDFGVAAPTIAESVFARCVSALKEERINAAKQFKKKRVAFRGDKKKVIEEIRRALMCSKICSYAQGFQLMRAADQEYNWKLNYESIALLWRAGCIIRAQFLGTIAAAYAKDPSLANLLLHGYFTKTIQKYEKDWRRTIIRAIEASVAAPTFSSALAYFDAYTSARLPANLTQAQRDFFGAHTYKRIDREGTFHTKWSD